MTRSFVYIAELKAFLKKVANRDTSADPKGWTAENPLWGHCAVASAVAQKMFGGELLRYDLKGTKYEFMRSHYANRLPEDFPGEERIVDFTAAQFGKDKPLKGIEPTVRGAFTDENTIKRYKLLYWRLMAARHNNPPLFRDEMYRRCFFAALDSDCAKMHFGCIFVHKGKVVHVDANRKIPAIAHRCEPDCCRNKITSRTEPMIGACSHAEEGLLRDVANMGIKPKEIEMYIAGFQTDMTPWLKTKAEHTCVRCATAMHLAGVKAVYVPVVDCWEALDLSTMLDTAFGYAVGEKKV